MSNDEVRQRLEAPFPRQAIRQREGGRGKMLDYLETQTVIRRLNDATDGAWDFRVTRLEWHGDLLIATGELTIPPLGTRTGTGVQKVSERAGEDILKGAASDALKKSATLFGVGLDLYGADYEAGEAAPSPRQPAPAARADGVVAADDWTTFWTWARGQGLQGRAAVEQTVGRSIDGLKPAQLRSMIEGGGRSPAPPPAAGGNDITEKQVRMIVDMLMACHLSEDEGHTMAKPHGADRYDGLSKRGASKLIEQLIERRKEIETERVAHEEELAPAGFGAVEGEPGMDRWT